METPQEHAPSSPKSANAKKMAAYRARMRAKGLRPIQLWVPDTRHPDFAEEIARQSRLTSASKEEQEILDFIEDVADWPE